jgi:hypothetical protein
LPGAQRNGNYCAPQTGNASMFVVALLVLGAGLLAAL